MTDVTIILACLSLYLSYVTGASPLQSAFIRNKGRAKSASCCKKYHVDPKCIGICIDKDRLFIGKMVCNYKYDHIAKACREGLQTIPDPAHIVFRVWKAMHCPEARNHSAVNRTQMALVGATGHLRYSTETFVALLTLVYLVT